LSVMLFITKSGSYLQHPGSRCVLLAAECQLQRKVVQTVQQHVSYEFTLICTTCDYN